MLKCLDLKFELQNSMKASYANIKGATNVPLLQRFGKASAAFRQ